jgi:pimeloyl-ACP methyl ester carboxylesterase
VASPATQDVRRGPFLKFAGFPKEMAVRPSQIRASAAETALMVPAAFSSAKTYDEFAMPIIIIAGEEDRLIDIDEQSARLHDEVKQSKMHRIAGAGHMVQQSATGDLMAAIDQAAAETVHYCRTANGSSGLHSRA